MKGKRAEGKTNKTHTMVYLYRLANTPSKWLSTRIARPQGTSHVRPTTGMKADRRFAVPRCWSGGDSNCRSSLRSIYSGKVVTREISTRPFQKIREAFLRRVSSTARLNRAIFQQSPTSKRPKRDRRFESPPLHQRGSANRRSRSISATKKLPPVRLNSRSRSSGVSTSELVVSPAADGKGRARELGRG